MRLRLKQVAAGLTGTTSLADLLTAKGDVLAASASGTLSKVAVGVDGRVLTADSTAPAGLAWTAVSGGSSGGLLAWKNHNPATLLSYTSSTGPTAIDSTNVAVTFTAPASGKVIVRASAYLSPPAGNSVRMCLMSGGSVVAGTRQIITGGTVPARCHYATAVTGLTSGASYTYALAWWCAATASIYYGDDNTNSAQGPVLLEVLQAP